MNHFRTIYHLMYADFLERVRSASFLWMLLFTICLTYFFIPALDAPIYAILNLGGYRPVYNSAWIGAMTTLLMGEFFLLFAFYLLKGAVERDRQTGVGQIIATTPTSKPVYLLGKWFSNLAVMLAMVAVIILAAVLLQFIRGEDLHLNLWALLSPFLIVLLPALVVIAGVAVWFESINLLRGGLGNLLFFFVAFPILTLLDLQGNQVLYPSIYRACAENFSNCNPVRQIDLNGLPLFDLPTFRYAGVPWTAGVIAERAALLLVGLAIVLSATVAFHRFDPAKSESGLLGSFFKRTKVALLSFVRRQGKAGGPEEDFPIPVMKPMHLTPLGVASPGTAVCPRLILHLLAAELRLFFKSVGWLWAAGALILMGALYLAPLETAHFYLIPLAWLWPLTLWSGMGGREARFRTESIVFSAPSPLWRQMVMTWLAGVLIALALASGVIIRLALAGQWIALAAVSIGAFFVPSIALAMGCWSGSSKLFEAAYLFVWYLATFQGIPQLDFMGRIPNALQMGIPWIVAGLTVLLVAASIAGRYFKLKS